MRRADPGQRLGSIAAAGTRVFGRLGYRRAHMADVAADAGLSTGAVYSYVESKEALFHLVFAHGFGLLGEGAPPLPVAAPPFGDTLDLIAQGLRKGAATPLLRAALHEPDPADARAELTAIVEERYAMTERLWPLLAVIERCAVDLPELDEFYFGRGRRAHIGQLGRYVQQRSASGHFRPQADPAITARLVTEAITWFAWHRREDRDAALYDDATARRAVTEFVRDALVAPGR
jgi:AcrR family transcriptional regulator